MEPFASAAAQSNIACLLNLLGDSNMAIYQCFFFSGDQIGYWENIKCDGRMPLTAALKDRLASGTWKHAEAWSDGRLVCDVSRRRSGNGGASNFASNHSVLRFAE